MVPPPVAPVLDDRYELGEAIGAGAMGEVRRGWDRRLSRDVAVKLLRRDLAADPDVRVRFEQEARSAARLAHPAIVTVFDTGESDGVPFIVMERLPGRTLADELAAGPLPSDVVAELGTDLAGALAAAHAAGVLHRDVKPGNVLRTESGGVKLADFGIAKSADAASSLTVTGTVLGSPAYLAPERLEGRPSTEASDLYALGVVLYEALTGERAFAGDTPVAVAHAVVTRAPVPLAERMPGLDPATAAAIDAAMARDPADRPTSAAAFGALLAGVPPVTAVEEPAASGATQVLPVAASPTTVLRTGEPPTEAIPVPMAAAAPGRQPPWAAAAVAALVVAALVLVGWQASRGDAPSDGVVSGGTTTSAPTTTAPTTATTAPPTTAPPTTAAPAPPERPGPGPGPRPGNGRGNGNGHRDD